MRVRTVLLLAATASVSCLPLPAHAAPTPTCAGLPATIVGTNGNDVLKGTAGPDVIVGLAGNDVIRPGGGDDIVCGGTGHDLLRSLRGADTFRGGPQRDRIEALSESPSRVFGGGGPDMILFTVSLDPGYVLEGGRGHDVGVVGRGSDDTDTLPTLVIDRRAQTFAREGLVTGVFRSIEQVGLDERMAYEFFGSDAPDYVSIADGSFPFHAVTYGGDDVVVSSAGDDVIDTGAGDDRVDAGPGDDECLNAERTRGCETFTPRVLDGRG